MKNLLAVVLVVSVASIALSQVGPPTAPPARNAERMRALAGGLAPDPAAPGVAKQQQRWEYKVTDRGGFNPDAWEKRLNDMAKDGWELDQIDQGEGHYIFKRAVQVAGLLRGGFAAPVLPPAAP